MNRKEFHEKIVRHLSEQPWIKKSEIDELDASISHWIQSQDLNYPYFTNAMRKEISFLMATKENAELFSDYAWQEESKPWQPYLKFIFDDLPYPPPAQYDFTFIDLFAGIGGFRLAFQRADRWSGFFRQETGIYK